MKSVALTFFLATSVFADVPVPRPATQAEVNAGMLTQPYVSPATLAGAGLTNGTFTGNGGGLTNTPLQLGIVATGSNGAAATMMLGLDASGKPTTNAVPAGGTGVLNGAANVGLNSLFSVTNSGTGNGSLMTRVSDNAGHGLIFTELENDGVYQLGDVTGSNYNSNVSAYTNLPGLRIWARDNNDFGGGDNRATGVGYGTLNDANGVSEGGALYFTHLGAYDQVIVGGTFGHVETQRGLFTVFGFLDYSGYDNGDWGNYPNPTQPTAAVDVCGAGTNMPGLRLRSQSSRGGLYTNNLPGLIEDLGTNLVWIDDNKAAHYIVDSLTPVPTNAPASGGYVYFSDLTQHPFTNLVSGLPSQTITNTLPGNLLPSGGDVDEKEIINFGSAPASFIINISQGTTNVTLFARTASLWTAVPITFKWSLMRSNNVLYCEGGTVNCQGADGLIVFGQDNSTLPIMKSFVYDPTSPVNLIYSNSVSLATVIGVLHQQIINP